MAFDFSTAVDVEEGKQDPGQKVGDAPAKTQAAPLETSIPFDWGSMADVPEMPGNVEKPGEGLTIGPLEKPKENFLDAFQRVVKDSGFTGPGALGKEIGDKVGEMTGFGEEEARKQQIARSQAVYNLSEASGVPIHQVDMHFDELVKDPKMTGIKGDFTTPLDVLELGMTYAMPFAFLSAPLATIKGVLMFAALDKLIPTKDLIPHDAPRNVKDALKLVDFIAKGALTAGVYKKASPLLDEAIERFTLNKLTEFKLPTEVKLTPEQVKDIWQTGNLTSQEQKDFFNGMGLNNEQVKIAMKNGVTIKIPAQKVTKIMDKPFWEKIKDIFGEEPTNEVNTSTAGDIVKGPSGLIEDANMRKIVEDAGGIFIGYQKPEITKSGKMFGNSVFFNSPKTGSTLALKFDQLTPENIRAKIADSDAKFSEEVINETAKLEDEAKQKKTQEDTGGQGSGSEKFQGGGAEKKSKGLHQTKVNPEDIKAALKDKIGGMEYVQAVQTPELLKLAKFLTGEEVGIKKSLGKALGQFVHLDFATSWIELSKAVFSDPALAQGVLAHEIGHLFDWLEDKTLLRGNILGRLGSLLDYHKTVLPEKPGAPGELTPADRARLRRIAEQEVAARARSKAKTDEVGNQFDPDMVLAIWNRVEQSGIPPELMEYVKRLDAEGKKTLVRQALEARKKGEPLTIEDARKFKQEFDENPEKVAEVYADLIKEEIKKRKLFDQETISAELKALTKWWHPFDETKNKSYTDYRFDSRELYAEFISVLLNAPAKAKEMAPKSYEAFWNFIGNKPEVLKTILDTQALIQGSNGELYKQRGQDIKGMFETGEEMFRARQLRYEEAKKSLPFHVKNMVWDKNTSILEKLPEIRKDEKIHPDIDPKYILEKNDYVASVVKAHLELLNPVFQEIMSNGHMADVDLYMFAKRVAGDRAEFANPLGHNPETAQAQLDFMKKEDPARFDKIERLVTQIQDWFKSSINPLMEDLYTAEQMKMVNANENYAPFRVIDFMKDYVAAGIIAQTGTVREIASPFTALVMKASSMVSAATRNEIKKNIGNFMLRHTSQFEMEPAKVTNFFDGERQVFNIAKPSDKTKGTIVWRQGGTWRAYHVDKFIADIFERGDNQFLATAGRVFDTLLGNNFFRQVWITFNPTFQARNLFRDFGRSWKAHPEMTLGRTIQAYVKAVPHAVAKAKGEFDPVINDMYRNSALGVTLNDIILNEAGEDIEIEKTLERYGIMPEKKSKAQDIPVLKQLVDLLEGIRILGDTIETIPKVAGWMNLEKLPVEQRAYMVRNLIGTPNYKRGGRLKPISNSAFLFSNIIKEGYRGMLELSTDPELRGQYWKKTVMVNILHKVLLLAAGIGLFGKELKDIIDGMTEYDKSNYLVVPIGMNENGESEYLRLPQDEDGRFFGAIFWKLINGMEDPGKAFKDIFSFTAGQLPGPAPAFDLLSKWGQWMAGQTPRDEFRGRDILTKDQRAAGGWSAFTPMAIWTLNQTGLSGFQVYDRLKDQTIWKKTIALTPVVQSFYRETNYGKQEQLRTALEHAQTDEAKERIRLESEIEKDPKAAINAQESEKDKNKIRRKISREEVKKGTDPIARVLTQATSNNQKIAVFKAAFDQFGSSKELAAYLETSVEKKVISQEVSNSVMSEYEKAKRKA